MSTAKRICKCCRAFKSKTSFVMSDVFEAEAATVVDPNQSYIRAYRHMLSSLEALDEFAESDFIRAAHMVYGWMPTILEIYADQPLTVAQGAALLTKAKKDGVLSHVELGQLAQLVNHSMVGASKLLHMVNPAAFPIWDSRIYGFVHGQTAHQYRVNNVSAYEHYMLILGELQKDRRFVELRASVNRKMGYPVTALRALEVVMFLNSDTQASKDL